MNTIAPLCLFNTVFNRYETKNHYLITPTCNTPAKIKFKHGFRVASTLQFFFFTTHNFHKQSCTIYSVKSTFSDIKC